MSGNGVDKEYQEIKDDLAQLQKDIGVLFGAIKETGQSTLSDAQQEAAQRIRETGHVTSERAREAGDKIKEEYQERPLLFTLAAFVIGMIFGKMFMGRNS